MSYVWLCRETLNYKKTIPTEHIKLNVNNCLESQFTLHTSAEGKEQSKPSDFSPLFFCLSKIFGKLDPPDENSWIRACAGIALQSGQKLRKLTILKNPCKLHLYFDTFSEVYWNIYVGGSVALHRCRKYISPTAQPP